MDRFRGASEHSLDDKGRLIVPKRFLEIIQSEAAQDTTFLLTAGFDSSLLLLGKESFEEIVERIGLDPLVGRRQRVLRRLFIGHAEEVRLDKSGRLVIPDVLRRYADIGLDREVVLVGTGSMIEIWSRKKWTDATANAGTDQELFETDAVGSTASAGT